jgi:membrane-associated phospholipid phosphatase
MSQNEIFLWLQRVLEAFPPLAALAFVALGLLALNKGRFSMFQAVMVLCSLSLVAADAIKDQLKFLFGRTWPETWMSNNPSLIHDGVYGFNPFHGGAGFASFPSGHAAAICAVMSVLWIYYRRWARVDCPLCSIFRFEESPEWSGPLLRLDVCRLDDRPPFLDFAVLEFSKRLRALLLWGKDVLGERRELRADFRIG